MRILLDQAETDFRNIGNNAMLEVALNRLRTKWPTASMGIITRSKYILSLYYPEIYPITPIGHVGSFNNRNISIIIRHMPRSLRRLLFELREEVLHRQVVSTSDCALNDLDQISENLVDEREVQVGYSQKPEEAKNQQAVLMEIIREYNLYVAVGSQYACDVCKKTFMPLLDRLWTSKELGLPTVMVGQGIGPINDPQLLDKMKLVLPRLDLIAIRENLFAPKILETIGVDPSRVTLTGDDAIELAYENRRQTLGTGIGLGIRAMWYTEISEPEIQLFRKIIHEIASKYHSTLIAIPISYHPVEDDNKIIKQLMDGYNNTWIDRKRFTSPVEIIRKVSNCRLVITGAFHSAVFALAQGIPAVCVARSDSYANKFLGLADRFGPGCACILLSDELWEEKFINAINFAWESAEYFRPQLLEAAVQQINAGHTAYQRVFDIAELR